MPVVVSRVETTRDRKQFFDLPYRAYRGEPNWRAPLRFERKELLDPGKNPALDTMTLQMFLAWRDGEPVGRIAAFVNHAHLNIHKDDTGHFGLFDTMRADDFETQEALLQTAAEWLRGKGLVRIGGPYDLSVNDECGMLVDGFDTPPCALMPYGRPEYPAALEKLGFTKAMDMFALRYVMPEEYRPPEFVARFKERFDADPRMSLRPVDMSKLAGDLKLVVDIFNDAWSDNWGFIPFTDEAAAHMASALKEILRPDGLWISMIDGEPVSFTLMIPNLNEAAHGLDGRLLPFGWAQLLYRLKFGRIATGRIPLAGTKRSVQKTRRGMTATVGAWEACLRAQHAHGIREIEFSWVLETNKDLLGLADIYACERYKTYRIYQKSL